MTSKERLAREACRLYAAARGRGCSVQGARQDVARRQGISIIEAAQRAAAGQSSYDRQTEAERIRRLNAKTCATINARRARFGYQGT